MQRRKFLQLGLAAPLGSKLGRGYSTSSEARLKFGGSDTALFPFRGGELGHWGYVDQAGRVVISPDDSSIAGRWSDFYGGLCAVHLPIGSAWMINATGAKQFQIYPDLCDWNYVLRDGLMPNRERDSGKWGYANSVGRWVIAPEFDFAFPFSEERAVVKVAGLGGVIDTNGNWILQPSLAWAVGYSDGLLCIEKKRRFEYLDRDGKSAFAGNFEWATLFRGGVAAVREGGISRIIDKSGKDVMPGMRGEVWLGDGPENPALLKQDDSFAILRDGKLLPLRARKVEPFSCGRAIVYEDGDGSAHFIGPDGTKLFGTSYWRPEPFVLGRAAVYLTKWGERAWIDTDGKVVFRWS